MTQLNVDNNKESIQQDKLSDVLSYNPYLSFLFIRSESLASLYLQLHV